MPDNFKPSECGALVVDSIQKWQGLDVDLAVPIGREIPEATLNWLMQNAERSMRPVIYQQQDPSRKNLQKIP